jgi:hypothetical protein
MSTRRCELERQPATVPGCAALLPETVGEELLWRPDLQEHKTSKASGEKVLRYERNAKRGLVAEFRESLDEHLPCCRVRYAF